MFFFHMERVRPNGGELHVTVVARKAVTWVLPQDMLQKVDARGETSLTQRAVVGVDPTLKVATCMGMETTL